MQRGFVTRRHPAKGWSALPWRLSSPAARLLIGAIAALIILQLLVFSGFHGGSSSAALRLSEQAALEQRMAALQEDNAQLRTMYKHLEGQLSLASTELGSRGLISDGVRKELLQQSVLAAVAMVTFNRPSYLQKATGSLLSVHRRDPANMRKFPLYISQDGGHKGVRELALSLAPRIKYMQHIEDALPKLRHRKESFAYYRIANHYKFILQQMFDCRQYERLIIVEDDMLFAPDFFSFFEATAQVLDQDPTLYCVSSWNDHGQKAFVSDPQRVERSDFFPGLGWMLRRELWDSFADQWPKSYWDDWMRESEVRKGRQCIRPEVCRTYNFGERGSSGGQYYYRYLVPIKLNTADVPWGKKDMSYLKLDAYDAAFNRSLAAAKPVDLGQLEGVKGDVKVYYNSEREYEEITGRLHMLREWRVGVPRGSYRGTVQVSLRNGAIHMFIVPAPGFKWVKPQGEVITDRTGAVKKIIRYSPLPAKTSDSSGSSSWFGWWGGKQPTPSTRRQYGRDSEGLEERYHRWQDEEEARWQGFEGIEDYY